MVSKELCGRSSPCNCDRLARVMHGDTSDADGAGPAPAAAAAAAVGAASPGVSSVEVYGFVGWITSSVAYVLFMLWAYTPDRVLEAHGITYYPSKYWALALPAWACATVVFVFWLYESLCMMSVPPPGDPSALRDHATKRKEDVGLSSYFCGADRGIPPLVDVPQQLASLVLHGGMRPAEAERLFDRQRLQRQRERARGMGEEGWPLPG